MDHRFNETAYFNPDVLSYGLTGEILINGVNAAYRLLDTIDLPLLGEADMRLADIVELANLSAMFGNILASGIVRHCEGNFQRAGPHKYQDLRANCDTATDIEIKVALEANKPKGHLAKAGNYLTFRYVLGDADGQFAPDRRGNVIWIWEIRFGHLDEADFAISNTEGDSGKTAVVNQQGMKQLKLVYYDQQFSPFRRPGYYWRTYGPS